MKSRRSWLRSGRAYNGRLAFDPDSGFHVDAKGRRLVTTDGGTSWRYAKRADPPHNARYASGEVARVAGTHLEHEPEPHHFEVQPDDPHFAGVEQLPDELAVRQTAHAEAWRD